MLSRQLHIVGRTADYVTDLPQNGTVVIATGQPPRVTLEKFLFRLQSRVSPGSGTIAPRGSDKDILVVTGNLKHEEVAKSYEFSAKAGDSSND